MPLTKVTRDQFEKLSNLQVRHKPLGIVVSSRPYLDPKDAAAEVMVRTTDRELDDDGNEYDHDEVKRVAIDILRDLASGAIR